MQTIRTNLKNNASTQYTNYPFTSMCMCNGKVLGAGPDGLFRLGCGDTDNGTQIDAYFEPMTSNLGYVGRTRLFFVYLEISCVNDIEIDVTIDKVYLSTLTVPSTGGKFIYVSVKGRRSFKGNFFTFNVKNTLGGDFSVHTINVLPMYLHKGRK